MGTIGNVESEEYTALYEQRTGAIRSLLAYRFEARRRRNYALSDEIRECLRGIGISLTDNPSGSVTLQETL